jgi:hypothetical protein
MDDAHEANGTPSGGRISKCISGAKQLADMNQGFSRELRRMNEEFKRALENLGKRESPKGRG